MKQYGGEANLQHARAARQWSFSCSNIFGYLCSMVEESIEQKSITISIKMAAWILLAIAGTCIGTASAAGFWAQNVTNHLASVDSTLLEMKDSLKEVRAVTVIDERTRSMESRIERLEEWRLQQVHSDSLK